MHCFPMDVAVSASSAPRTDGLRTMRHSAKPAPSFAIGASIVDFVLPIAVSAVAAASAVIAGFPDLASPAAAHCIGDGRWGLGPNRFRLDDRRVHQLWVRPGRPAASARRLLNPTIDTPARNASTSRRYGAHQARRAPGSKGCRPAQTRQRHIRCRRCSSQDPSRTRRRSS
jgi:hypothetical protein